MSKTIDIETYLAINGAGRQGIGDAALHKNKGKSDRAWSAAVERQAAKDRELCDRRQALRLEYAAKVAAGEIRPPTRIETLQRIAAGHPDNAATIAARKLLAKRGLKTC